MSRGTEGSIATGVIGENGAPPVGPFPKGEGVVSVDGSPAASFGICGLFPADGGLLLFGGLLFSSCSSSWSSSCSSVGSSSSWSSSCSSGGSSSSCSSSCSSGGSSSSCSSSCSSGGSSSSWSSSCSSGGSSSSGSSGGSYSSGSSGGSSSMVQVKVSGSGSAITSGMKAKT